MDDADLQVIISVKSDHLKDQAGSELFDQTSLPDDAGQRMGVKGICDRDTVEKFFFFFESMEKFHDLR